MRKFLTITTLACITLTGIHLPAFSQDQKKIITSGGKLRPVQANMDIRHYRIALDVDIGKQAISGSTEITLNLATPADTILFDLIDVYTIHEILVDKKKNSFTHKGESVIITNQKKFAAGRHLVRISYSGKPPVAIKPPWDGGFTWTKDKTGNPWVVINCQLNGAKIYFPCKDHPSDEPNEGADLLITVPGGLSVAGPGLLQSVKKQQSNKQTWHWKTKYTISNYCILFNIAKYDVVSRDYTTIEGNKVPMQFYVLAEDKSNAEKLLDIRERDTRVLEKYFGEYPWQKEKIGIAQVPNPGMEHQTMITYGDGFKYVKYPGFDYSDNLFHEFSHEWFANRVTNTDWAHMWIQEGIATYADALLFRELMGEYGYDSIMFAKRRSIKNEVPIVQGEGLNMSEVYNGDIYVKGAFFMHTLRYILGDSLFFPALKKLCTDVVYPYDRFLNSNDVEKHFSAASGKDLKPLFDFYLYTTRTMDFYLRRISPAKYALFARNLPMEIPVDVQTDSGIIRLNLEEAKPGNVIYIESQTVPVIDPRGWYFKRVLMD